MKVDVRKLVCLGYLVVKTSDHTEISFESIPDDRLAAIVYVTL